MKTIIIYSSKYGATKECSKILADKIGEVIDLVDIKNIKKVDLNQYDNIVIGSPIYMGMINRKIIEYCNLNLEKLSKKMLYIFICGMSGEEKAFETMKKFFPQDILKLAISKYYLGGKLNTSKLGFFDRLITKMVEKASKNSSQEFETEILFKNIQMLADDINKI